MLATNKQTGIAALIVVSILAGTFGIYSYYVGTSIAPVYQAVVRNIIQLVILLGLFALPIGRRKAIVRTDWKWFFFRSVCGMINALLLYIAFTRITIGATYFLSFAAATICGYIVGSLIFKERINRRGFVILGLSIAGLSCVYSFSFDASTLWYSLTALLSGIIAPGWSVFSKAIYKTYSNIQTNLVDTLLATIATIILSRALNENWSPITWNGQWVAIFAFAVVSLVIMILIVYGFRRVEAQLGTLLLLIEIVAGIALGFTFFRQTIPIGSVIGGSMILVAIYLQTRNKSLL